MKRTSKLRNLRHSDPKAYWNMLNKFSRERKGILKKGFSRCFFYEYFSKLNTIHTEDENNVFGLSKIPYFNNELNCPFTAEEISKTISSLKNQKACSAEDYILNEYIKLSEDLLVPVYCKLLNLILQKGIDRCEGYIYQYTKIKGIRKLQKTTEV